jgi:AcrR family transcriptional regulator
MTENATRGEARENAILRAAFELLAEIGFERLTMDAVAIRARASKATIYRRWPGKAELIAAALRLYAGNETMQIAESDSLRGDLIAMLRALRDKFQRSDRALFSGLIRAMQCDAELAEIMRAQIANNKAMVGDLIATRAAQRGEPVPDLEIIREIAPAQLIIRLLITGEPVDDDYISELVDDIVLPLLTRKVLTST